MAKRGPKITRLNCEDCKIVLDYGNIVWLGTTRASRCHECYKIRMRHNYYKSKEKDSGFIRKSNLESRYGISEKEYNELVEFQQGGCAICRKSCESGQKLSVDHNHETNEIRGLLCRKCNSAIGLLNEDENLIWNLIEYLKRTTWNKKEIA